MDKINTQAKTNMIAMIIFHVMCLFAFFINVNVEAIAVAIVKYVLTGFGITIGFHRLLTHKSFKTSRVFQFILAFFGSLAIQGGPMWWVAHHRHHHANTDTDDDIHSPKTKGLWQSHIGWMSTPGAFKADLNTARDLYKFPEIKFLQKYYVWLIILQPIFLFCLGEWLTNTTGLEVLVWGFFISTVFTWHVTFFTNSICHKWGSRTYDTNDDSTNNYLISLLNGGEGWHNNHHKYPNSACHGLEWWQFDLSWEVIKILRAFNVIYDVKTPKLTNA